ncbi:cbb3-type cytochrome oxidase assembly protein CcoS [Dyadobacter sp. NIV53]|uniref:cbb3-type cytochrome oxidase assembly protein CcoS n=1 Tax=Dyadobacter sp. NIV53 TaxID=2861765 RepID=UPI001C86A5A1|nr:cbb3-type cytochrome oxidase assembly protein CcoS [Dyadobacter sp. NIV53]
MSAIYIMIIASLFIAFSFLGAFVWSVKRGHYDDDYTPSVRILLDSEVEKVTQRATE